MITVGSDYQDRFRKINFSTAEKKKDGDIDSEEESHYPPYMMESGAGSTAQIQSPGHDVIDFMKSTSSVNSMTSGRNPADRKFPGKDPSQPNYVNIVGMPKSGMKTARKGGNKSEIKPHAPAPLSELHSPAIPTLNPTASTQSTKHPQVLPSTNLKQTQSSVPPKKVPVSTKPKATGKAK